MTCAGCEAHIKNEVNKLEGILEVDANYETSKAFVKFDNSKVSASEIATAIVFYDCENCKEVLRPKEGDCCVFCSYGTVPCPPIQQDKSCCN